MNIIDIVPFFRFAWKRAHDDMGVLWFEFKWRKLNKHNFTTPKNYFPINSVIVGKKTYGELNVFSMSNSNSVLKIGNYCSIAPNVMFMLAVEHNTKTISTYPFKVMSWGEKYEAGSKGDIVVEDDVWIGMNAMIMSGVRIGKGAIVGGGSRNERRSTFFHSGRCSCEIC